MVVLKCPLCLSVEYDLTFSVKTFKVVKCKKCQHFFSLIEEEVNEKELYSSGDYEEFDSRDTIFEKIIDNENRRILKSIEKLVKPSKILDFGCGKGKFLKMAQQTGWASFGIETSAPRAEFGIKNYGLKIIKSQYTEGKIAEGPFDVITFFHVLEHIGESKYLLKIIIRDNLKEKGMVVIEVPNFLSFQSIIAKNKWLHLDVPRHINHFTYPQIISLLRDLNLKLVKVEYLSLIPGLQGMVNSLLNLFGYKKNLISELKYNRNLTLVLIVLIALPFSLVLEVVASLLRRGAVLRVYANKI